MVNSVTFSPAIGGDGSTYTDNADPTTGLAGRGYVDRLVPMFSNVVNVATQMNVKAAEAAASAASALGAPGTNATSATSMTVSVASKSFTLAQTGKAYSIGQTVIIARTSAPGTTQMVGIITAFNSGTGAITVDVAQIVGSGGPFTDWTISMGVIVNSALPAQSAGTANYFLQSSGASAIASWQPALRPSQNLADVASPATSRTNLGLGSLAVLSTVADAQFTGQLSIAKGGTSASSAGAALTALGAAARGANTDITSLGGLTTAIPITGGGTGATTATAARSNLGLGSVATLNAITDTQFSGQLSVAKGGTAATDANGARSNLVAAKSGANSDITSLTGLTTALSLGQGGTGGNTAILARNNILPAKTGKGGFALQVNVGETDYELAWRAFATFTGAGSVLASVNVASVTRTDTGDFTITFTNAAPDVYYWVSGSGNRASSGDSMIFSRNRTSANTTAAAYVTFSDQSGAPDNPGTASVVMGY